MAIPEKMLSGGQLGRPIQYFPARRASKRWLRWIGFAVLMGSVGLLLFGLWRGWSVWSSIGPLRMAEALFAPLVASGGMLFLALACLLLSQRKRERGILLFEHGLRVAGNDRVSDWPWSSIREIYLRQPASALSGLTTQTALEMRLVDQTGRQIRLGPRVPGIDQLSEIVAQRAGEAILARSRPAFVSDESLFFGAVTLHIRNGVMIRGHWLPWKAVAHIRLEKGQLRVQTQERTLTARTDEIANLHVLLALAATKTKVILPQ